MRCPWTWRTGSRSPRSRAPSRARAGIRSTAASSATWSASSALFARSRRQGDVLHARLDRRALSRTWCARIVSAGHELASHGYSHVRATEQSERRISRGRDTHQGDARGARRCSGQRLSGDQLFHRRGATSGRSTSCSARAIATARASIPSVTICTACRMRHALRSAPRPGAILEMPITTIDIGTQAHTVRRRRVLPLVSVCLVALGPATRQRARAPARRVLLPSVGNRPRAAARQQCAAALAHSSLPRARAHGTPSEAVAARFSLVAHGSRVRGGAGVMNAALAPAPVLEVRRRISRR